MNHNSTQLPFRAGAARVDISPVNGIQLAGGAGYRRGSTGVLDPIFVRAVVLEQDGKRFCILSIEVLAVDMPWAAEIRRRLHKTYGFAPGSVMIHATQNHASPSIGNIALPNSDPHIPEEFFWLRCGDPRYNEPAVARILEAVGQALQRLAPVQVAAGRAIDGRVAFNRRYVMRHGKTECQPVGCNPEILHVEGPMDPEVGVVTFTARDGNVIAALLHHTSHPCNGYFSTAVLPDWPGAWSREIETHFGPSCVAPVINGCCGNIITFNYLSPDQPVAEAGGDYKSMGRLLAQSAKRALESMTPVETDAFTWASQIVHLPRRIIPADVVAQSRQMLQDHPQPVWTPNGTINAAWFYAVGFLDLHREQTADPHCHSEIQALRLGNFALVAVGGEPFVESQLRIKRESPFPFTHVAHMCNGHIGYLPTAHAFAGGGYETITGVVSRLAPPAAEIVECGAAELLRKLA